MPAIYPGRITLFKAGSPSPEEEKLRRKLEDLDPTMGWCALSPLPVEVYLVPGSHDTMIAEPFVQSLARQLRDALTSQEKNHVE